MNQNYFYFIFIIIRIKREVFFTFYILNIICTMMLAIHKITWVHGAITLNRFYIE